MTGYDDLHEVIRDALNDAIEYRRQLAAACPARCAERGVTCEDCAPHADAADGYEHAEACLDFPDDPVPLPAPRRRGTDDVRVRGNRL